MKAVLFDIDGTLIAVNDLSTRAFKSTVLRMTDSTVGIESRWTSGKTDSQIMSELLSRTGLGECEVERLMPEALREYESAYRSVLEPGSLALLPGVEEAVGVLDALRKRTGYPLLGLITGNLRDVAFRKLRAVGMDPALFSAGAFGEDGRDRDELPGKAIERAGRVLNEQIASSQVLIVGDTPRDVRAARAAACPVLAVGSGEYTREELMAESPDFYLQSLGSPCEAQLLLEMVDGKLRP